VKSVGSLGLDGDMVQDVVQPHQALHHGFDEKLNALVALLRGS